MENEFKSKVYSLIDEFLIKTKKDTGVLYDLQGSSEGQEAIEIIFEHKLVSRRSSNPNSIIDVTSKGSSVVETGGIENYLSSISKDNQVRQEKENRKLDLDIKSAELVTKYFWIPLILSIIAIILTILQLVLS